MAVAGAAGAEVVVVAAALEALRTSEYIAHQCPRDFCSLHRQRPTEMTTLEPRYSPLSTGNTGHTRMHMHPCQLLGCICPSLKLVQIIVRCPQTARDSNVPGYNSGQGHGQGQHS